MVKINIEGFENEEVTEFEVEAVKLDDFLDKLEQKIKLLGVEEVTRLANDLYNDFDNYLGNEKNKLSTREKSFGGSHLAFFCTNLKNKGINLPNK